MIRQQTNLTSQLRERVRHLEKQLDLERKERRTLEKRTERTKREFKQQLKYSKHAARVHERTADKLKEKLRKEYERQSSLKTRGEELLRQHRVASSPGFCNEYDRENTFFLEAEDERHSCILFRYVGSKRHSYPF